MSATGRRILSRLSVPDEIRRLQDRIVRLENVSERAVNIADAENNPVFGVAGTGRGLYGPSFGSSSGLARIMNQFSNEVGGRGEVHVNFNLHSIWVGAGGVPAGTNLNVFCTARPPSGYPVFIETGTAVMESWGFRLERPAGGVSWWPDTTAYPYSHTLRAAPAGWSGGDPVLQIYWSYCFFGT